MNNKAFLPSTNTSNKCSCLFPYFPSLEWRLAGEQAVSDFLVYDLKLHWLFATVHTQREWIVTLQRPTLNGRKSPSLFLNRRTLVFNEIFSMNSSAPSKKKKRKQWGTHATRVKLLMEWLSLKRAKTELKPQQLKLGLVPRWCQIYTARGTFC
jgi:hypothetical protein